ncbi:ABC transporter permease [Compostibacter hankyongensis]|uniref:ABC transporter permease n=1 Tax=Compostibacter hankyongensis TaxID=1007089 RepID=A0ABP8FLD6_9BACT
MFTTLKILWNSLLIALQELKGNKLRTFLSLLGVTIGIFCIISVLTLTKSLERNIRDQMSSLGSNVVYVGKWPWAGGGGEWWKYWNRPSAKFTEFKAVQQRLTNAGACAYEYKSGGKTVEYGNDYMSGVTMEAITYDFADIQQLKIASGRFFTQNETNGNGQVLIVGANIWDGLFGTPEQTIGKTVSFEGRKFTIVGAMQRYGDNMVGAFDYDNSVLVPYLAARQIVDDRGPWVDPAIMVKANQNVSVGALKDELRGVLRSVRKLRPTEDDNFALNELSMVNDGMNQMFGSLNLGGGAIGILALIVGAFGIANIMFVTVKERTNIIGLKKAIGAKRNVIMAEFLLESILLCLIGGAMGMGLVYLITKLITSSVSFNIYMSAGIVAAGIATSVITGILAGFIPAYSAARLDPVVAIRS